MTAVCPECAANKCRNCDGTAWDDVTDALTSCPCKHSTSAAFLCGPKPPSEADLKAVEEFAQFLREKGPA